MLSGIIPLEDLDLENQRVLVRAHLDVPLNKAGQVEDDVPLRKLLPTLKALEQTGARIIVCSRFGEARGQPASAAQEKAKSIEPVAAKLAELADAEVHLPDTATSDAVRKVVEGLRPGRICVLENLVREEDTGAGAETFARSLMSQVDVFLADSLRALNYPSATTTLLPRLLEKRGVGLCLAQELAAFARLRSAVDQPRLLIWGGNSLTSRWDDLQAQLPLAQRVFLVGVAANTMLAALGGDLGDSAVEADALAAARTLAEKLGDRLLLPSDLITATHAKDDASVVRPAARVGSGRMALDLGPETRKSLEQEIAAAGCVIWAGGAGFFRNPAFAVGTRHLVEALGATKAFTVVVGDDSVAAARGTAPEAAAQIDCVSDGGPSAFSLLSNRKLVGLEALRGIPK